MSDYLEAVVEPHCIDREHKIATVKSLLTRDNSPETLIIIFRRCCTCRVNWQPECVDSTGAYFDFNKLPESEKKKLLQSQEMAFLAYDVDYIADNDS